MGNMLVSIIIPTFNSEKFIAETIQSIQAQTYTKWEVIIVDDDNGFDDPPSVENSEKVEDG